MADRHDVYKQFGPLLVEAVADLLLGEINVLRAKLGLPEHSKKKMLKAIDDRLKTVTKLNWMEKENGS